MSADGITVDNPVVDVSSTPVTEASVTSNIDPAVATSAQRTEYLIDLLTGAGNPTTTLTEPEATPPEIPAESTETSPVPEPAPVVEPGPDVPDKFKNMDGSINTDLLLKSYLYAEKKISEQGGQLSEVGQLRQMIEQLQAQVAEPQPGQAQPPVSGGLQSPGEEQFADIKEKFFEKFYDNPQDALSNLIETVIEKTLSPVLNPILARQQFDQDVAHWQREVDSVMAKYPDFNQLKDSITAVLAEKGESFLDTPGALESAYWIAKGKTAQPVPDIDALLKTPEVLARIKSDPEVQKAILSNFTQQVSAEPKPVVMGRTAGGTPPAAPPMEIKSTKDASKASAAYFAKIFGGG